MTSTQAPPGSVLGVWAHPDDEAYLSAGLMAAARAAGHRVVVVTATRGEHGTDDPGAWPPERLAPLRERELQASLAALDVHEHHWLEYRDGSLADVNATGPVARVAALLEEVRPDVVVTFGPEGMTGHPDHRTVSGWVTAAWRATGRRSPLWYATLTPGFHAEWGALNVELGLWFDQSEPPTTPDDDIVHVVRCEGDLAERKFACLRAHTSQTQPLIALVGEERYRAWWATEWFTCADPAAAP